jgi:hypothetical protein
LRGQRYGHPATNKPVDRRRAQVYGFNNTWADLWAIAEATFGQLFDQI